MYCIATYRSWKQTFHLSKIEKVLLKGRQLRKESSDHIPFDQVILKVFKAQNYVQVIDWFTGHWSTFPMNQFYLPSEDLIVVERQYVESSLQRNFGPSETCTHLPFNHHCFAMMPIFYINVAVCTIYCSKKKRNQKKWYIWTIKHFVRIVRSKAILCWDINKWSTTCFCRKYLLSLHTKQRH